MTVKLNSSIRGPVRQQQTTPPENPARNNAAVTPAVTQEVSQPLTVQDGFDQDSSIRGPLQQQQTTSLQNPARNNAAGTPAVTQAVSQPLTVQDGFDITPAAASTLSSESESGPVASSQGQSMSVGDLMRFVASGAPLVAGAQQQQVADTTAAGEAPVTAADGATVTATGTPGTGSGTGQVAASDIPPATGVDDQYLGAVPESPEEAVDRITNPDNELYQLNPEQRARDMVWLAAHHPEQLPQVYETLGPEESAQLIEQTVELGLYNDNHQAFQSNESSASILNTLGTSLAAMPADFQTQVGTHAAQEGLLDMSLVFRQPSGSAAAPGALDPARAAFAEALHQQALTDPEAARAVGNALAGSQELVNRYAAPTSAGGWGSDFTTILDTGLSQQDYTQAAWNSTQSSMRDEGLEQVVGMMAHYDGPDADFTKTNVFKTAAYALEESGGDNPALVSGMEELFMSDSRAITEWMASGTRPDDPTHQIPNPAEDPRGKALGIFFQEAVFENPDPQGEVVMEMNRLMSEYRGEMMSSNDPAVYDHAGRHIGYLLGAIGEGYEAAAAENKDTQEAREALVNMAWGAIKGPATNAAGEFTGPAGSFVAGHALDAGQKWIVDFINGDLQEDLDTMEEISGSFINEALRGLPDHKKDALLAWVGGLSAVNNSP
ncbi:hypothetical protein ACN28I_45885 [Archangium gephyra]|uniref:hypothetical protein n=1 Tax=Archangium gephyra TaxID=48 RepID=UPI003B817EEE